MPWDADVTQNNSNSTKKKQKKTAQAMESRRVLRSPVDLDLELSLAGAPKPDVDTPGERWRRLNPTPQTFRGSTPGGKSRGQRSDPDDSESHVARTKAPRERLFSSRPERL